MRAPIGCDRQSAIEYMGCTETMFETISRLGVVRSVRKGWYLFADLDAAAERLIQLRNESRGENEQESKGIAKKRRHLGSQGDRSYDGRTQELLRKLG